MPNAIIIYRIANWFYVHKIPFIPILLQGLIFLIYNSKIPYKNIIGKNTSFTCKGIGVVLIDGLIIGDNCRIGIHNIFVGKSPYKEVPRIGNNVWIGPGSIIVGPVIIKDNVIIAPNAVVTKSVPEGAIVGGIPAKIIGWVKDLDYDIMKNESWKNGYMDYLSL